MLFKIFLKSDIFKVGKSKLCPLISRNIKSTSKITSDIETVDLAYTVWDQSGTTTTKPPLVIFHGVVGSRKGWDGMSKAINQATGRRVITFDARNHGDSPHSPQHTFLHMAHDVIEMLKKLELTKVSVLGHSMGAGTALVLASIRPDLLSSVIIEDISLVTTRNHRALIILKLLDAMKAMRIRSDVSMSKAIELAHEHLKTVTADVNIRNYLIDSLVNTNTGLYTWKCNVPILEENGLKLLFYEHNFKGVQYAGPTLFIGGSLSDFIRETDLPEIRKYFPSAELTYVDGAGHWVHSQKPEKFLEILCKFLKEK